MFSRLCFFLIGLSLSIFAFAQESQSLPTQQFQIWLVKVVLNEQEQAGFFHCYLDALGQYWMTASELERLDFPKDIPPTEQFQGHPLIHLTAYRNLEASLDKHNMVLFLRTPIEWSKGVVITTEPILNGKIRPEIPGFYLNYDITSRQENFSGLNYSASLGEAGYFNRYGVGTSSFIVNGYNYYIGEHNQSRLETRWTLDEPEKIASWRFGDSISSGLQWTGAVRFAGIQYATNFNTQPTLVTFPQPQVRGEAALPSVVDVYVNNTLGLQQSIDRGGFLLNQVPVVTGAGNLEVVTTDLLGRQQISVMPYYASPILLKPGLVDFSYEAGVIRDNYAIDDFNYGRGLASATYSIGVTNRYTTGIHGELLSNQQTLGFIHNYLLGYWGTFSLGYAGSHNDQGFGGLVSAGLNHNGRIISYGATATFATENYTQVGTIYSPNYPPSTIQSFAGLNLGDKGSIMATYTALNNAYNENKDVWNNYLFPNSQIVSISYSKSVYKQLFFNGGAFIDPKNTRNNQLFLTLSLPFDNDKLLSVNHQDQTGFSQNGLRLTKNLPFSEGFGYQLQISDNKNYPTEGNLLVQRDYGLFSARYANFNQQNNYEVNARGSLVHFAGHNFPARYVEQSFALVEVPDFPEVAVYSRNQLVGKTNKSGYLYIPETLPYQINELEIDPRSLPFNTQLSTVKQVVVPYWKSGALARFGVTRIQSILLTLKLENGTVVPAGAEAFINNEQELLPVGYDGQIFISAKNNKSISGYAKWLNKRCYFNYNFNSKTEKIIKDTVLCSLAAF